MKRLAVLLSLSFAMSAFAGDEYHVYKLSNGECEIDTRDPKQYKSARGGVELSKHGYRMDAEKDRVSRVKKGECKCPSGQNC